MERNSEIRRPTASATAAAKPWQARHDVQFYDDESQLASSVAAFLAEGVRSAQPVIVIARPSHVRAFRAALSRRGVDADTINPSDLVWLDADQALSAFMEGSRPNPELFDATIGNVFEKITANRRYVTVRAYGEMVDILWSEGKSQAALALEELWNSLAARYSFALLCAYGTKSISPGDAAGLERICALHSQVLSPRPLS